MSTNIFNLFQKMPQTQEDINFKVLLGFLEKSATESPQLYLIEDDITERISYIEKLHVGVPNGFVSKWNRGLYPFWGMSAPRIFTHKSQNLIVFLRMPPAFIDKENEYAPKFMTCSYDAPIAFGHFVYANKSRIEIFLGDRFYKLVLNRERVRLEETDYLCRSL